ncbi:MAG TPA: hypothetical protein ENN30_01635 [Candidatus Woesearchaeota archaeon]|nr:hypothetical protein [Candidatus Woesearchaeota archaeon]
MADIVIGRSLRDVEKYGLEGTIFVGKQYVKMGKTMSLANRVLMDVVRPHVILVAGKRGEGKCLHGDTPIVLSDGSIKPIKELAEDSNDILALNERLKLKKSGKSKFYVREVDELIEIKLRTGKTIKLTPEHPLLTILGWEHACNLDVGSRIATPRKINSFGSELMSDAEVKILAYLIAKGHLRNGFVLFSNKDNKIIDDFKKEVNFFDKNLKIKTHSKEGCFKIVENKRHGRNIDSRSSIRKWLDSLGIYGKKSVDRIAPDILFKLPKHKISLFLNRLFSCDGTIYPRTNTWDISYSSSSRKLIEQIQHLLLRFGIISIVKQRKTKCNPNYELVIRGQNLTKYLQEIGFFGEKELKAATALKEIIFTENNPNLDTIPKEIWDWYRPSNWAEVGRAIGYSIPKGSRSSVNYAPSRQKLLQIAGVDENETVKQLAESDIYWDEIVNIKRMSGTFAVYDISVPGLHNFVAGDVIVHNSYTLAMIAEGISDLPKEISMNIAPVFLDTMGIFWTMKEPNYRDEELLSKWDLEPKGLANVKIFVPGGKFKELLDKGIPVDEKFYLTTSEILPDEWAFVMGISPTDSIGILISKVVTNLRKRGERYDIDDIIENIKIETDTPAEIKTAAVSRFENVKNWGLFSREGTPIDSIISGGQASVLDISIYSHIYGAFSIRSLVVGLFAKKVLEQRQAVRKVEEKEEIEKGISYFSQREAKKKRIPMVWLIIDEVHEFLPKTGSSLATGPLLQLIREGRQPGISVMVATQQPGKLHTDVLTQCDLVISHRVTSKLDLEALNEIMQTYMTESLGKQLDDMPRVKGCALILDQNQERIYSAQMRPRFSWHGGETPTAIPPKPKDLWG